MRMKPEAPSAKTLAQNGAKALDCMARAGLPLAGIAPFSAIARDLIPCRAAARLPEKAGSILVAAVSYHVPALQNEGRNVARYAALRDYHGIMDRLLGNAATCLAEAFPEYAFQPFSDNSPIPEVRAAVLAGLGFRGRHGLLITERYGSYVVLGELVTDLPLPPYAPDGKSAADPGCGDCRLCRSACPSPGALEDKSRCVSALTQKKGALSSGEEALIRKAGFVYGCDHCQDVCPYNRDILPAFTRDFYEDIRPRVDADTELHNRAYAWRGRATLLRNLEILKRNGEE